MTMKTYIELNVGDEVHRTDDPRHVGRVIAVFQTRTVKVRWLDNGWFSEEDVGDLTTAT
jgi:hypothetical protein